MNINIIEVAVVHSSTPQQLKDEYVITEYKYMAAGVWFGYVPEVMEWIYFTFKIE